MKILMISKACYVAAYRRKLEELSALPDVDLTLIVPPYWQMGDKKAAFEEGFDKGYRIVIENPLLNGKHHLHFYSRLGKHLAEIKPDLVHIDEEPYDFVTFHATLLAKRAGAKIVFFTWQNLYRDFPPPFGFFERYVLSRADAGIVGNLEAADILRQKGFKRDLPYIPQFGVDTTVFQAQRQEKLEADPLRIAYAGRLVPEKGITDLVQGVNKLKGHWELLILGDGPQREEILSLVRELLLEERVKLLDSIPSTEMPEFFNKIDVLVLPSLSTPRWKEQFGRVLTEAMACGVVVVGSDSGEIPNVIGDAGLTFPEGESEQLASRLQQLIDDNSLVQDRADRGRERVLEHFTQEKIARDTYDLYCKVLS